MADDLGPHDKTTEREKVLRKSDLGGGDSDPNRTHIGDTPLGKPLPEDSDPPRMRPEAGQQSATYTGGDVAQAQASHGRSNGPLTAHAPLSKGLTNDKG